MAKVKSAGLRNYVGRLGGSVYYMNKGQNIGRELAPEVSNPRTPAQMRQRMKWANLVNFYKSSRPWMGHLSFENKPQTWSDYNAFMSANISQNPVYLTKQAVDNGECIIAPYVVTKGTLPHVDYSYYASDSAFVTNIALGESASYLTVGELSALILENNPTMQLGDQISIIAYEAERNSPLAVYPFEIILDPTNGTALDDVVVNGIALTDITSVSSVDTLLINPGNSFGTLYYGVAVVLSRTFSGRTSVSTQNVEMSPDAAVLFHSMGSDEQFNYAADSYGMGTKYFLAAEPSEPVELEQAIVSVSYAGTTASNWAAIDWAQEVTPQNLVVTMRKDFEGTVTLKAGGVTLTPVASGRTATAEVSAQQQEQIHGASAANRKIVVTDGANTYEWS